MIPDTKQWMSSMRHIATLLQRLFGGDAGIDDHLKGAVDLSDSAYCFDLLSKHGADAICCPAAAECK